MEAFGLLGCQLHCRLGFASGRGALRGNILIGDGLDDVAWLGNEVWGCQLLEGMLCVPHGPYWCLNAPLKLVVAVKGEREFVDLLQGGEREGLSLVYAPYSLHPGTWLRVVPQGPPG